MTLMIYGATGYTGELIAQQALKLGLRPLLAGRNPQALAALGQQLGLEHRVLDLQKPPSAADFAGVSVVLNAAGKVALPALVQVALHHQMHYLDLSGEHPEFQQVHVHDQQARHHNVMLMPGVGFGVVPTDTLALHLKNRLPTATHLSLGFETLGGVSGGTLETVLHDLQQPGARLRGGQMVPTPAAWQNRTVDLGKGPTRLFTHPWRADVFTAHLSTGIPNVDTYAAVPGELVPLFLVSKHARQLLTLPWVQNLIRTQARKTGNPSAQDRQQGKTRIWGEATDGKGTWASAVMEGPEAYDYTALTAAHIAKRVLDGHFHPGFQTPSRVYGADFVLGLPGVTRQDR